MKGERPMLGKIVFAAALFAATAAGAQIKAEHPRFCVMSVGPAQMMFNAFQENRTDEIFCHHVPTLGPTMIILDATSSELREMNIEARILRDVGQKDWRDDLDANTVASIPPKKYLERRGTTNFTHDFSAEGPYIALVRATSDDGVKEYVGEYRFSVGQSGLESMATGAIAAALGCMVIVMWRRSAAGAAAAPRKSTSATPRESAG
jgi:hypothetical protein